MRIVYSIFILYTAKWLHPPVVELADAIPARTAGASAHFTIGVAFGRLLRILKKKIR